MFCDDLSFDADDTSYKSLKTMLEGGIEGRPENVIFYATSNRRHLLAREMVENERSTAINPGEAVEEKVSLSDRFGLWLGFHRCSQDEYLAMVEGYVARYRMPIARRRVAPRGARMGNDARRAFGPRGVAIRAGFGGAARRARDERARSSSPAPGPQIARLNQAPLRYCEGSTGVAPLRISKCNCGEVTLPVWPDAQSPGRASRYRRA